MNKIYENKIYEYIDISRKRNSMNKIYENKIYEYADISRKSALMNRRNF